MTMDLFTAYGDNLLPFDGEVNYYGKILSDADRYLSALLEKVPWKPDEAVINGQRITTRRRVAWYGDDRYAYTYSGTTRQALEWIPELTDLKAIVEQKLGEVFNSCLLNLYRNGSEGMSWHSDDEAALGHNTTIASLSLGAPRPFRLRHKKTGETIAVLLEHGSLLVMKGATQTHWLHSLPPKAKVTRPRVNLTFRTIIG